MSFHLVGIIINKNKKSLVWLTGDNIHNNCRYITRDELEQAMAEYGMGDEASIKQVLDEVDKDKVRIFFRLTNSICIDLIITPTEFTGWEYRLWRVCGNDEEGKLYLRQLSGLMMEEVVYICLFQQILQVQATMQV